MFVTPFFNNALNSFMMISAAAISSRLRLSSSRRCPVLPDRVVSSSFGTAWAVITVGQETRVQDEDTPSFRLDKVREVPFRGSRTEQCGRHDVCMPLHLLVLRAVINGKVDPLGDQIRREHSMLS